MNMLIQDLLIYALLAFIAFGALGIVAYIVLSRMRDRGHLERALDMRLLLIRVPRDQTSQDNMAQRMREAVGLFEQFLASLSTFHAKGWNKFIYGEPYFVFEIANHASGEDLYFYITAPFKDIDVIEKQLYSSFPFCEITQVKDYSIFAQNAEAAGAYLKLAENPILPTKTYQRIDNDPMSSILIAMSKLEKEGQGAAIQILVRPSHNKSKRDLALATAREMQSGHNFKDALKRAQAPKKEGEDDKDQLRPRSVSPSDEEVLKAIAGKANKYNFDVNIRLITAAADAFTAESLLDEFLSFISIFSSVELNSYKAEKVKGRDLKKLLYNFAFRLFDDKKAILLSSEEIASIYHLPTAQTSAPRVGFLKAKPAEPPTNIPDEGLVVASSFFRGRELPIRISRDDRRRHMYIIGQTGTGKSVIMKNWIKQDLENGEGLGIMDPAGEFAEFALSLVPKNRVEDVVYFDPSDLERPLGLNMLEVDPKNSEEKTLVINELLSVLDRLYNLKETGGAMFEKYFRNSLGLLLEDYEYEIPVMADVTRVFTDKKYRDAKLARIRDKNPLIVQFWTQEAEKASGDFSLENFAVYISTKLDIFISNDFLRPILNQQKSTIDFKKIMNGQQILLCNLSKGKIGEINAKLLGSLIVSKISVAAFARQTDVPNEDDRKDFYLYMDEFQNFTVDSIKTILSEARKYRLPLIMAHQYISQLPDDIKAAVYGNVGSKVFLRIGADDSIREEVKTTFAPIYTSADLATIDNLNGYVSLLINGKVTQPFNIRFKYFKSGPKEYADAVREISRLKYGRPRDIIEEEIKSRYKQTLANVG